MLAAAVARVARGPVAGPTLRCYAGGGLKGFAEHEKAAEDLYFTREDQRIFNKLMGKVKAQSDSRDSTAAAGVKAAEMAGIKAIVDKYKMSHDDVEKLLQWKHTHY